MKIKSLAFSIMSYMRLEDLLKLEEEKRMLAMFDNNQVGKKVSIAIDLRGLKLTADKLKEIKFCILYKRYGFVNITLEINSRHSYELDKVM